MSGVKKLQALGTPPLLLQSLFSSLDPRPAFEAGSGQFPCYSSGLEGRGPDSGAPPSWEELAARKRVSHEPRPS